MTTVAGQAIKAQREAAGLTLKELAARVGCSESHLSRLENGERRGSKYFLAHLAVVLSEVREAS